MRRIRKNLITGQSPTHDASALRAALSAREANLLGENGLVHGQDRYVATASPGDLVLPLDQLNEEQKALLEERMGKLVSHTVGCGRELELSELVKDGVSIAEPSDIDALINLGAAIASETAYRSITFDPLRAREFAEMYLAETETHKIFVHKSRGRLQGALFGYVTDYIFSRDLMAAEELFYIYPEDRKSRIAIKLMRAFETWARTKSVIEICFSVSTQDQADRIGRFYEKMDYVRVGGVYKKKMQEHAT
ncbi:GNAT family N-acetyltransferase [Roseibium porphyridii]|uniref:GNAT family N-acetyltransferase n=1 Tax=Roseibium porphyridii TaxID=2866279 RepID=A0ABY8F6U0_9HYPH|nr:GNAT family N-acetyltransferase [Roseibium sp. KMA01]WFE90484.1 GNAT family N-acetyltransferase [Roseibium sp. KMA01]